QWNHESLHTGFASYDLFDQYQRNQAEYQLSRLNYSGQLDNNYWNQFTQQSSAWMLGSGSFIVSYDLVPGGSGSGWGVDWANPIGAFYDSQSEAHDAAASIAAHLPVALDAQGRALTAQQLAGMDTDGDGELAVAEAQGLRLWRDLDEDGRLDADEASAVGEGIASDRWDPLARGRGQTAASGDAAAPSWSLATAGMPAKPAPIAIAQPVSTVPPSNYTTLRNTDELYFPPSGGYGVWAPTQIKINFRSPHVMVGTEGADSFDSTYYSAYSSWFNLSLLTHFLGGGGNDMVGGSARDDSLWGGTGNDVLFGYTGNDRVYGEEGDDELYGDEGADVLDGGIGHDFLIGGRGDDTAFGGAGDDELQGQNGNDRLLGQAGNDRLFGYLGNDQMWGGDGNDMLQGFIAFNETLSYTTADPMTDDDQLWGEAGDDHLYGGLGNDTLDGGTGNDGLLGEYGNDKLFGGAGADELQGGDGNDQLLGDADDDTLFGQVGNDQLCGGDGNDILMGFTASNEAQQTLYAGQTDDDVLMGEAGHDNLFGGWGNDRLNGGTGNDMLLGDQGNDDLWGGSDNDQLQGGAGNDRLMGDDGDDRLFGQVGNDQLWGGAGDDVLVGFTGEDEVQQSLLAGESDDDQLHGGAGKDLLVSGLGTDALFGGDGDDELQGGDGDDALYGDTGNDLLFGQVGNDVLYGGDGDDVLQGFTASNESQQALLAGQSDDDHLYGGAGRDTLVGRVGNDYLDGGAGADVMIGGSGDDTYVVNSVNDVIYEQAGEGHDTVIASTSYLLNAEVEDLELLEGFATHGTGNARDNRITGNSANNILDGVSGADTMIGGRGDDTYYVDNALDRVVEADGEGVDTVQSSVSLTLGHGVEHLKLLDFGHPELGLVDGQEVLVYGYPKRNELDYMQGDAVANYEGTCALTSIANLLTQSGRPTSESQVVQLAIENRWAVSDPSLPSYQLGGSSVLDQQRILDSYGMRNDVIEGYNEAGMAQLLRSGRGVILAVNAGRLWSEAEYEGGGEVNHAVTLTGAVFRADDGELAGFYVADSGRARVDDMTRFVDIETFRQAAQVPGAYAIYTVEPVKFWDENINGTGNALDNTLQGNRGDNQLWGLDGDDSLSGGEGQDSLRGGAGNDRYRFARGDGVDHVDQSDALDTDWDTVEFAPGIASDQLWFRQIGLDLEVSVVGTNDRIVVDRWYDEASPRVDAFVAGDGQQLFSEQVDALVRVMADLAPPAAGQTSLSATPYASVLTPVLASNWT
ncbi:MAG TPA: calcium-binding protein, partial [Hydrogenophaga sp.]